MADTILERHVIPAGPLQSLTADELQLDREPVTISPRPQKARAWVRFGPETARVECRVERWTMWLSVCVSSPPSRGMTKTAPQPRSVGC